MTEERLPAVLAYALPDEAAMKDWAELLVQRARAEGVESLGWYARSFRPCPARKGTRVA